MSTSNPLSDSAYQGRPIEILADILSRNSQRPLEQMSGSETTTALVESSFLLFLEKGRAGILEAAGEVITVFHHQAAARSAARGGTLTPLTAEVRHELCQAFAVSMLSGLIENGTKGMREAIFGANAAVASEVNQHTLPKVA